MLSVKRVAAQYTVLLTLMILFTLTARATVRVERTEYKEWKNCYRISNGEVELIVTGDVVPESSDSALSEARTSSRNFLNKSARAAKRNFSLEVAIVYGKLPRIQ